MATVTLWLLGLPDKQTSLKCVRNSLFDGHSFHALTIYVKQTACISAKTSNAFGGRAKTTGLFGGGTKVDGLVGKQNSNRNLKQHNQLENNLLLVRVWFKRNKVKVYSSDLRLCDRFWSRQFLFNSISPQIHRFHPGKPTNYSLRVHVLL